MPDFEEEQTNNINLQQKNNSPETQNLDLQFGVEVGDDYYDDLNEIPIYDPNYEKDLKAEKLVIDDDLSLEAPNAKKIWGVLVVKLRESKNITLHTACGEIREFKLDGFHITAYVKEDYLYKILTNSQNFEKIDLELKKIDDRISVEFVLKKHQESLSKHNLEVLRELFGDYLETE